MLHGNTILIVVKSLSVLTRADSVQFSSEKLSCFKGVLKDTFCAEKMKKTKWITFISVLTL